MTSRAHILDLTLTLLRRSAATIAGHPHGANPSDDRLPDQPAAWQAVIACASAHFVLPALAGAVDGDDHATNAIPADARQFLIAIRDQNAARNTMLRDSMLRIATALNEAAIVPVALKGAALLLDGAAGKSAPAPWRFMRDIDLLVPAERLDEAVRLLQGLGYIPATHDYDPGSDAHYPPLVSPDLTYCIELHTRLFARDDHGLSPAAIAAGATPASHVAPAIRCPSRHHRLAHVLVHAQLHNRNHATRRIVLKDLLDLSMIAGRDVASIDWPGLAARPPAAENRDALLGLIEAWRRLLAPAGLAQTSPQAEVWAHRSIARLVWPRWRNLLQAPADLAALELRRWRSEPGHLTRRAGLLCRPARLTATAAKWAFKQRQRRWS